MQSCGGLGCQDSWEHLKSEGAEAGGGDGGLNRLGARGSCTSMKSHAVGLAGKRTRRRNSHARAKALV